MSASPSRKLFARNFKEARLDAGLTQAEVAEICTMDRTTLSYIENEKHNVTLDMMDRMAKAVGKDLWKLLK